MIFVDFTAPFINVIPIRHITSTTVGANTCSWFHCKHILCTFCIYIVL